MQHNDPMLTKDISELTLSGEFLEMARMNNFKCLGDIVRVKISALMDRPGMNYRMLAEFGEALNRYGLMDYVDEG